MSSTLAICSPAPTPLPLPLLTPLLLLLLLLLPAMLLMTTGRVPRQSPVLQGAVVLSATHASPRPVRAGQQQQCVATSIWVGCMGRLALPQTQRANVALPPTPARATPPILAL